jgi:hypothetical protein
MPHVFLVLLLVVGVADQAPELIRRPLRDIKSLFRCSVPAVHSLHG